MTMRNALLFMDGAVHAALWTTGPLLLPSLLDGESRGGRARRRPPSAEDALAATTAAAVGGATSSSSPADDAGAGGFAGSATTAILPGRYPAGTTTSDFVVWYAWILLASLFGRRLGRRLATDGRPCRRRRSSRPRLVRVGVAATASLLPLNWGLGASTFGAWMGVRFVTAVVSGVVEAWGGERGALDDEGGKDHRRDGEGGGFGEERGERASSEGGAEGGDQIGSPPSSSQQWMEKKWLDGYWLAGAAASAFVGGTTFYPLNCLMAAFHPHERMYTILLVIGLGVLADGYLVRYHSKCKHSSLAPLVARSSFDQGSNETTNHPTNSRRSSLQRRKQVQMQSPVHTTFEEEEQITFHEGQIPRSNSFDSQQFFDCLEEIDLDGEHDRVDLESGTRAQTPTPSRENQIAVYSERAVVYPDGTPAYVPAGESVSVVPPGYLWLYKNKEAKAREKYRQTQEWRRGEQFFHGSAYRVHNIHSFSHNHFFEFKAAYSHVIHGFTPCGMPVVYEQPGKMKLKECMREAAKYGGKVDDLLFHYSYFMEYMSNLESILPMLHSDDDDDGGAWQEELAAFAHAKQKNLEKDPVAYRYCVVMDISGVGPSIASVDVLDYLKRSGDLNTQHYPGSLRRIIAVRAPLMVGMAWKYVDKVKPASLAIEVMSGKQMAAGALTRFIDEDQIPPEFGGRSRFRLGEHPFEVGMRKLVEGHKEYNPERPPPGSVEGPPPPPRDSTPLHHPPCAEDRAEGKGVNLASSMENGTATMKRDRPTSSSTKKEATVHEWDGLGSQSVLTATAVLHFLVFVVVGSLELGLPYWMISPTTDGGLGCDASRNGTALLVSSVIVAWLVKRSRFSRPMRSAVERSPLRGFRIGMGTACFALACAVPTPPLSDPSGSAPGLLLLSTLLALVFCGCALGVLSLERARAAAADAPEEGARGVPASLPSSSSSATAGRIFGGACVAPVLRRSVRRDAPLPFGASLSLCLPACVCGLLYVASFSLRATPGTPSPAPDGTRRRESQLMSVAIGCYSFAREVVLVAVSDVSFLADELC